MVDDEGAISYGDLRARTEVLANDLYGRGVGPGQAVGVMCRNGPRVVECFFAAALVGADFVLLNTVFGANALTTALSPHLIGTVVCDKKFVARARGPFE